MLILSKVEIANNIWDSELLISYLKFILKILSPFKCYFGIKILLNNKMFPTRFKGIIFRVLYGFRLLLWIILLGVFLFSFFNLNFPAAWGEWFENLYVLLTIDIIFTIPPIFIVSVISNISLRMPSIAGFRSLLT